MLIITKRILGPGFSFASTRARGKKDRASMQEETPEEQDAFRSYRKQVQKGSILRQFREDVFRRAELSEDWSKENVSQKEQAKIEKMMSVDREEMLHRVSSVEARAIQKRSVLEETTGRSLISDYGNYKSYDKVYPVLSDRNMGENEYLEDSHVAENLYKFIDTLPAEYQERDEVQAIINTYPVNKQKMTIAEYGQEMQKDLNDAQRKQLRRYEEHKIHQTHKYAVNKPTADENEDIRRDWFETAPEDTYNFTGIPKTIDPWNSQDGLEASLSPEAIDTIYDLYLQGWTVRDISKRFGIMPARTKFCVWVRAQLYHEVIPKLGVKYYLRALRFEERYNQEKSFCDYGLDIEELSNDGVITEITEWNSTMLDAGRREEQYFGAMKRLEEVKKFRKYEMVEVGTFDKENSKYRLKEWVIFRGKGSDEYFLKNKLLKTLTRSQKKFNKVYF